MALDPSPAVVSLAATAALAELGRIDLAQDDLAGVLLKVAELARTTVPGATEVSITLMSAGVAGTAAHTGQIALALDERQYDSGYGPCLAAAADQTAYVIADTAHEERWPAFVADAGARGVLATLSIGIPIRQTVTGGLNIYALEPTTFDDDAVAIARSFAGYAAVALANAHLYETTSALAQQMAEAMASRAIIEQAKGIVMAQQRISADEAFGVMSRASQVSNRKLREIAQALVDDAQRS